MLKKFLCLIFAFMILLCFSAVAEAPDIAAPSAILTAADSGLILYEKAAHQKQYPASTTKIMTAILTLENADLDDIATASFEAVNSITYDSSKIYLSQGEEMRIYDLLRALMIASANDAANVLAEHIGGSVKDFVSLMNTRAKELGAKNTHFVNPHGLHDSNHYTTAYDLAIMAKHAMSFPVFRELVSQTECTLPPTNKFDEERKVYTTNFLLQPVSGYFYKYATGIKTGYTSDALSCLVSAAQKDGAEYIAVVLRDEMQEGKSMHFIDSKKLLSYGIQEFPAHKAISYNEVISTVPVKNAKGTSTIILMPEKDVSLILPKGAKFEEVQKKEYILSQISAPVKKGDVMGRMEYWHGDTKIGEVKMIADRDYEKDALAPLKRVLKTIFSSIWTYIIAIVVLLFANGVNQSIKRKKRRRMRKAEYRSKLGK